MSTASEFGRGKTIFVLAIVIGCFAVLWPKIFYPMLTASISQTQGENAGSVCCDVISVKDTNAYEVMNEICSNIIRKEQMVMVQQPQDKGKKSSPVKVSTASLCRNEIMQTCGVDIIGLLKEDHSITTEYKKSLVQLRSLNTSHCIKLNYGVDVRDVGLPRKFKGPESSPSHMRPERPFRPGPDMVHPALRERGRAIPTVNIPRRTIEREARPGPVPGMRPPVGGAGHIPNAPKGGGTMGIIMPMYTIGIVCFFLYTIMKILFKKNPEAEQAKPAPIVKDYGLDPEHRKFVMSEEYAEGSDRSLKESFSKEDRDLGLRRRPSGGKSSARFYEDRRRLDAPPVIFPTYPSDLETDPETTTTPFTPSPDMPESSTPDTETVDDEAVKDEFITMPSTPSPFQSYIEEIADTQIQNVTNEPESEPEPFKDQMVIEKPDDDDADESSIPYSPLAQEIPLSTLHDIVHEIVTEAENYAESIKEIAEIPVAFEDDTAATSAGSGDDDVITGETTQNEPVIPVEEESKHTPPLSLGDDDEVKPESSKRHELSKEASVCSSADTVVAESVSGSENEVDDSAIEAVVSSLSSTAGEIEVVPKERIDIDPEESQKPAEISETEQQQQQVVDEPVIIPRKAVEPAAPPPSPRKPSVSEFGPLSPLAPDQTPESESDPPHFFDRTIVIPDYEPEAAARARKQSQQLAQEAVASLPSAPTEPEAEAELETITIVKQDSVPSEVLSLAEQVAERILEAAKSDLVIVAPTPQGESMIPLADDDDDAIIDTAATITIEPIPSESEPIVSQQPRLSLDTNLPLPSTNKLEATIATDANEAATTTTELLPSSDNLDTNFSSTPRAPATTPEIQVETPHADQTEMNRIAEFLEGLNTEPKEVEKLAAIPQEQQEIGQNAPIVTLADEAKDSFSDSPKASQPFITKSKLEITPIDDSQVGTSSSSTIADICYVTQPLDDSQKGVDKSKILKSSVEIVSFDEGLTVASEPMEKIRKCSEPVNIGLDSKSTETLEEAVKKLRHVAPKEPGELGDSKGPDAEKLKKATRKSSSAQSEDSIKESEIDKYVERLSNMQGSRKAMIEQAMFKSSSSQGSEPEQQQQQADQSSNFHGPGLLDSGQSSELPEEKIDKMKEVEKWATATIKNDDDNDEGGGKATDVVDIINDESQSQSPTKLEKVDDDLPIIEGHATTELNEEPEPGTDNFSLEIVVAPQGIIDRVDIFIDKALKDGIKKAVKIIQNREESNKSVPVVESREPEIVVELDKLDEVLEELSSATTINILSSVPIMESKVEMDKPLLLEPMEKEECPVSKILCDIIVNPIPIEEANLGGRDTNDTITTTTVQTQPIISTTCDNTNVDVEPQSLTMDNSMITQNVETPGVVVSEPPEKVTSLTSVKNTDVQIAEEPEAISSATAVEASALETTTTIPSESLPSTESTGASPPVAVESSETVTDTQITQEENAVEVGDEQQTVQVEEEIEETQEESPEEVMAELETIQEEIESLSTEIDQMESANVAAAAEKVNDEEKAKEQKELETQNEVSESQPHTEVVLPPQVEEPLKTEVALPVNEPAIVAEAVSKQEDAVQAEVQEVKESQQSPQVEESLVTMKAEESADAQVDAEKSQELIQNESPKAEEPVMALSQPEEAIQKELSPETGASVQQEPEILQSQETTEDQEIPKLDKQEAPAAAEPLKATEITETVETPSAEVTPSIVETPTTNELKITPVTEASSEEIVTDASKPEETPETPKPVDVLVEQVTPKPEEISQVVEAAKPEEIPQASEAAKQEELEGVLETPKAEEVQQALEIAKSETQTTEADLETPKPEESPQISEAAKPDEVPQVAEASKPEEQLQATEPSKLDEVPQALETPKPEESPQISEAAKPDEVTQVAEASKPEEQLQATEPSKLDEVPQALETSKPNEEPQASEIPKTEEVSQDAVASEEQKLDKEIPTEAEIPIKPEESSSTVTSSQPSELSKDEIIIPSEQQTDQPQPQEELQSVSLSPIEIPADVVIQPESKTSTVITEPQEEPKPLPDVSPAETVQQQQQEEGQAVSDDEQKPEVVETVSPDAIIATISTVPSTDSTQTDTLPPVVSLRFETLSEPPFPIPPSTSQTQNTFDNSKLVADPDTITASTIGVVESSNLSSSPASQQGASLALTVEQLDENSPDIFPLPSTQSISLSTTTSPVEKVQDQDVISQSPSVIVGVPLTEQASSSDADTAADQQATQASSAPATATITTTTTTTIDVVESSPPTDQVSSGELLDEEVPTSPAPPPTPAAHVLSEPPSFPTLSAEVSKQLQQEPEAQQVPQEAPATEEEVVVVVVEDKDAQPQQQVQVVKDDDDDGRKANRESGHRERDAIVTAVQGIVEAFDATKAPALSSPFVAPSRSSTTKGGTQEPASESSQTKPPLQPQPVEEDLEKLISGGAEATKKEDLATAPEKQEAQPLKPATRERKSSEKEVKFKLPPEEMEDEEEDLEEEVEIVRPPTPPKTLSKSKPKSPEPTPEPTVNVPTSSSHRDHDELLISSMQTTVTGNGATADNKSCSAGADIITTTPTYNIASKVTPLETITPPPSQMLLQKLDNNKDQSENIVEQSGVAAIAAAKAAGSPCSSPSERVSVIGIEETASLYSGERWDNRTPTPTFRQPTPPVPHRPPSPPEQIPSIYLEGPMAIKGQEIIVREAQTEVEGGEDYDLDDEYEPSAPVVLSGKVTLSVISSAAGGLLSPDEVTDAPSLSLDDRAQAENSRGRTSAGSSRRNMEAEISRAMNEEVKGKTDGKKSSNASSPDMDEYEVIGKGGFEEDEAVDVSLDDYLTATDAELDADRTHEDTAADISTIDDLKQDPLPQDEE